MKSLKDIQLQMCDVVLENRNEVIEKLLKPYFSFIDIDEMGKDEFGDLVLDEDTINVLGENMDGVIADVDGEVKYVFPFALYYVDTKDKVYFQCYVNTADDFSIVEICEDDFKCCSENIVYEFASKFFKK